MPIYITDGSEYTCTSSALRVNCCYLELGYCLDEHETVSRETPISSFLYAIPRAGLWTNCRKSPGNLAKLAKDFRIPNRQMHFVPARNERAIIGKLKEIDYYISKKYLIGPHVRSDAKMLSVRAELYGISIGKLFSGAEIVPSRTDFSVVTNSYIYYNPDSAGSNTFEVNGGIVTVTEPRLTF
jgi:hypothetical protein